ncbi:hypothetical protein [Halomicronema sp. CCY15110]|uniref:hypothetical protein n=1 Tax=Halomicronema sp. CCY15110 TaxID=2767773 RepID=UPI0019509179|nr:hypothetical protein [Halomicronema sp. CCY15110]
MTSTVLVAVALSTSENTRARKECCKKFQKLADFAEVDCDLIQYQGRYSTGRNACPRELPLDEDIARWFSKIRYRPWAWVYGMLAAYGLRPHEAWFCEFVEGDYQQALQVTQGKTGPRLVYPLYPEWVQRWGLVKVSRPQVTVPIKDDGTRDYEEYGRRACRQFTRYKVPFLPYDLRHAYGVRGSVKFGPAHGLTVPIMAAWMGHSPTVHLNLYNRWISGAQQQQQYQQFLDRTDGPSAP